MAGKTLSQAEMKNELTSIFYSAVQSNIKLVVNTIRMVNDVTSTNGTAGEKLRDNGGDAVRMMGDYIKSSVDNAVRLIDIGVNYTSQLLAQAGQQGQLEKAEAEIAAPPVEVLLSDKPGATPTAGITIGNDKSYGVEASFRSSEFRSDDGSLRLPVRVTFDPISFTLEPAEKRRVVASVAIPADAQPGRYAADVAIDGVPQIRLRFVLEVEGEPGEISISA
jgi:hypothetical protein